MFGWLGKGKGVDQSKTGGVGPSSGNSSTGGATVCATEPMPGFGAARDPKKEELCILVIQQDDYDWPAIIAEAVKAHSVGGRLPSFRVVQSAWPDIDIGAVENYQFHSDPLFAGLAKKFTRFPVLVKRQWRNGKPIPASGNPKDAALDRPITIFPHFVLIRNEFETPDRSHRHQLLALAFADALSTNAIQSILMLADKPVSQGALHRLRNTKFVNRPDEFPLLPQMYAAQHSSFFYGGQFPAVVKFGSAHAGFGKLRVKDHHDMEDIKTLLPLTKQSYCTAEPFIEAIGDLRLQKIGSHHRAFFRHSMCGAWKTNTQSSLLHEIPVTPLMIEWLEACSGMFGRDPRNRMSILTIDAVVEAPTAESDPVGYAALEALSSAADDESAAGGSNAFAPELLGQVASLKRSHILEVNGTSSGLAPATAKSDNLAIAELVLDYLADTLRLEIDPAELVPCTSSADVVLPC